MNDAAVIGQILRPLPMRLALILPAVAAAVVGATDITVAWTVGWATFLAWTVAEHYRRRRRQTRQPIGAPANPRVVMLDGRIVPIQLRRLGVEDGVEVFTNAAMLDGPPRNVLVDGASAAAVRLRWKR